jgi:hypothetical protein
MIVREFCVSHLPEVGTVGHRIRDLAIPILVQKSCCERTERRQKTPFPAVKFCHVESVRLIGFVRVSG